VQYLIDGHNLIPYIPGLSLGDLDDETELIRLLQVHARVRRSNVEVFFDKAPVGHSGTRKIGMITVHSVSNNSIADRAIIDRLRQMKKSAANWVVVSSDLWVQGESNRLGAKVMNSGEFSKALQNSLRMEQKRIKEESEPSAGEIDEWLKEFGEKKDSSDVMD
jgi:predicted RNA-binding protein with PIN domain